MRALLAILAKDLRLLWRDRAGLFFLTVAPMMVITVAGFSLANLYGADPTGQTAYDFPFVDEDGSALGRALRDHLAAEPAVRLEVVPTRADAEERVRDKRAGTALVVPRGSEAAMERGESADLLLYTDPVKYLERLNVRIRLLELRDQLAGEQRDAVARDARAQIDRAQTEARRLQDALAAARQDAERAYAEAQRARTDAIARLHAAVERSQEEVEQQVQRAAAAATSEASTAVQQQVEALRRPLRTYFDTLQARRLEFERWMADLRRLAGSHAGDIPPPPEFPALPSELSALIAAGPPPFHLPTPAPLRLRFPLLQLDLPAVPSPPVIAVPDLTIPAIPPMRGGLAITETNLTGGPLHINTFDQNVPGFSVTFLLLGMLLGVSLGLLDERDWGTFDRVRAMPVTAAHVLVGKLLARFLVGTAQMVALLAVGWLAFGISLGPQPWALLLPTAGIVFAGCAFGLVVAAVAPTRESVLPVGSIVIVTMAAVGGCWWPIDLEPRWMRSVALAFPTTWAMDAFNDLMIRRRTVVAALQPAAIMFGYGALYLMAGIALFGRRLRPRA